MAALNFTIEEALQFLRANRLLPEAIRDLPFIRREGKSLSIDPNRALQGKVNGIQVTNCELREICKKTDFSLHNCRC